MVRHQLFTPSLVMLLLLLLLMLVSYGASIPQLGKKSLSPQLQSWLAGVYGCYASWKSGS
ncbi:hypothetical protein GE21DRAFT_1292201 [Neurospora crassa]|nr:hypothetical protein GE21DRAFT_1292201 [Neurospora crassa]